MCWREGTAGVGTPRKAETCDVPGCAGNACAASMGGCVVLTGAVGAGCWVA